MEVWAPVPTIIDPLLVLSFGYELPLCITCAIYADLIGFDVIPCFAKKLIELADWRSAVP